MRSLRVAQKYIPKVKDALERNGFGRQQDLAEHLEISRDTLNRFLNGKPVGFLNFREICEKLGLDEKEIKDSKNHDSESLNSLENRLRGYAGLSDTQPTVPEAVSLERQTIALMFDLILQIDFKEQSQLFKQVIHSHQTAGFLIHGRAGCGQQFLVNRLLRLMRGWQNQSRIKIDVRYSGVARSISNLWRELALWLGLPKNAQPREIMERICERWQTQDVIFIFDTVDYMPPGLLPGWLKEFWEPLLAMAEQNKQKRETHLLMFLVDNCGSVCLSGDVALAEKYEHPEYPRLPLCLPSVNFFPLDVLEEWIDSAIGFSQVQIPAGLTAQILLEKSNNGVPQYVYEEICYHCGLSWEGGLAKWLI